MIAADEVPNIGPSGREAVDPIEPGQSKFPVLVPLTDVLRRTAVDVTENIGHKGRPTIPFYVRRNEPEFLCDAKVASVADQPGVGEKETTGIRIQVWTFAKMVGPYASSQEKRWQRLDEDPILIPDEVQIRLLRHEDLAVQQLLTMQRTRCGR